MDKDSLIKFTSLPNDVQEYHWGRVVLDNAPSFIDFSHKIIINGDDFGMNTSINTAVIKSFENSLISSTSIITNMQGFKDAVHLFHANKYLPRNVGVHINLTEGFPLTEPIKKCKRFCNKEGLFIHKRKQPIFLLTSEEKSAVYKEIKAQISKTFDSHISPSHLDSHHHIHTEWGVSKIVIQLAKEFRIHKMRVCRNMGKDHNSFKKIYKTAFNFYLKSKLGIKGSHFFGEINDLVKMQKQIPAGNIIEIMTHPRFDDNGTLVDYDLNCLQRKLTPLLSSNKISYKDL